MGMEMVLASDAKDLHTVARAQFVEQDSTLAMLRAALYTLDHVNWEPTPDKFTCLESRLTNLAYMAVEKVNEFKQSLTAADDVTVEAVRRQMGKLWDAVSLLEAVAEGLKTCAQDDEGVMSARTVTDAALTRVRGSIEAFDPII